MRILSTSVIMAGILASIAVIISLNIIPPIMGTKGIDLTRDLGMAFSSTSPHVAGSIFLAVLGILWAAIFSVVQGNLPGNYLVKGSIFGLFVGIFSLMVLPSIMTVLDAMFGAPNQYLVTQFGMNAQGMVNILAYVIFGVILAITYRPSETSSSL